MAEEPGIPCPICGETLPRDSESCPTCGAAVSEPALRELTRALQIDSGKAHDLFRSGVTSASDLAGRSVDDVLKERQSGVLFLCPECGAFVSSADRTCARCGVSLSEESMELDQFLAEETRACPFCGEKVPADAIVCPTCQRQIAATPGGPGPTTELCLNCGATLLPDQETCESCGTPAHGIPESLRAEKGVVCATCGAVFPVGTPTCEMCGSPLPPKAEAQTVPEAAPVAHADAAAEVRPESEEEVAEELDRLAHDVEAEAREAAEAGPTRLVRPAAELTLAASPPPRRRREERYREVALFATVAALIPASIVATNPSEVGRWSMLAIAGSLLAAAVALLLVDPSPLHGRGREFAMAGLGGFLVLLVPVHLAAGVSFSPEVDLVFIAAGAMGAVAGSAPWRRSPAVYAPWYAMLPAFVAVEAAEATGFPSGPAPVSIAVWIAIAVGVSLSAAYRVRRRWVNRRIAETMRRAEGFARKKDLGAAIRELDRAIRIGGAEGPEAPWYSKGAALVVLGRYEEALACIDTALRINPRNEVAWVNKGNALVRMGRLVDALRCYNSAIKVNPAYEVAWNNKGNALARLGKFPDALKCYERALTIDAKYRGAWVNKGYVLTKLGDYEAAAKCADAVLRLGSPGGVAA